MIWTCFLGGSHLFASVQDLHHGKGDAFMENYTFEVSVHLGERLGQQSRWLLWKTRNRSETTKGTVQRI